MVALIGDSHAGQIFLGIRDSSDETLSKVIFMGAGSCYPTIGVDSREGCGKQLKLALNWSLPRGLSFYSNVGVAAVPTSGTATRGRPMGSGQLWLALATSVSIFGEAFAAGVTASQDRSRLGALGVTFLVSPQLQVDARAGTGIGVFAGRHFAGVGFSVRR